MSSNSGQKEAARIQAQATKEAAQIQAQSTREQMALQERLYGRQEDYLKEEQGYNRNITSMNQANAQPFIDNGMRGFNELTNVTTDPNSWYNQGFNFNDYTNGDEYKFITERGNNALNSSLAAGKGLLSGAALKKSMEFNQGLASQQYDNAYSKWNEQKNNRYNALNNLSNYGVQGASLFQGGSARDMGGTNLANAAGGYSAQASNTIGQGANNQANNVLSGAQQQAQYLIAGDQAKNGLMSSALQLAGTIGGAMIGGPVGASAGGAIAGKLV